MHEHQMEQVSVVLGQVCGWPAGDRLTLAREILQTLDHEFANKPPVQRSLANLFGLLETGESPPSDDECDNILKDELLRKYSS